MLLPGRRQAANLFSSQFKILQIDDLWKCKISEFVHRTISNKNPNSFCNYFLKSTEHSNRAARQCKVLAIRIKYSSLPHN